jgi:hypothetical protein
MNAWVSLQLRANEFLRRSACVDRPSLRRVVHILEHQATGTTHSWEVLSEDAVRHPYDPYLVVARTWYSDEDYPKLDTLNFAFLDLDDPASFSAFAKLMPPEPTIETTEFMIAPTAVDQILDWITGINLPMVRGRGSVGWNGTSYELYLGDLLACSAFSWWEDGPTEWKELTRPVLKLLGQIREEATAGV